jgi:ribonuclease HI
VRVIVHTDSSYVERAFTDGWLSGWQRNGWRTKDRKDVKNRDLWEELFALTRQHEVEFKRVKGHSGIELNDRVDELAVAERDRQPR